MDMKNSDEKQHTSPPEKDNKQPGGLQRFFRKGLIWLVVIVIAFSVGMAADHFLRYKPLSDTHDETRAELDQARQDLSDMQSEIDNLNRLNQKAGENIAELETENIELQDEIETTITHLRLFQVLVDVSNARVALFRENVVEAKATLVNTQQRLEELLPRIAEFDPALAEDMPQRLNLIISGLDRDTETALIDLELITSDLLDIEEVVFGD